MDIEAILEMYEDDYNPSSKVPGPRNMYNQGQLVRNTVDGLRPGYSGRNKGIGSGSPGVPKTYETVRDQLYTEETKATPVGERLQWIANNGKNHNNPETFIKAYEKHFKHKIVSETDVLFNTSGKKPLTQVDNLINTGRKAQDLFTLKKGFNEEELFKASIIQNNPEIKKEFKTLFKDIHKNVSEFSELGPEGIVEKLNKGKLLNDFDFIKSTVIGNREIGGVHSGITRNSLLNAAGIPTEHLTSYQSVRKPLMAISEIIENLKNPSKAKEFGISPTTATKIRGQLENFLEGEKNLRADIKKINNQLGDVKFNNIFGGVNFEHTLAKQFGKDYKYLPRNYLLKGQFTSQAFNMMKKDAFDLPLIRLMKQYEQGKVSGAKVQEFIDDFNAKTNNYADFKFDVDKGKLGYTSDSVTYDLSRYNDPNVARQELIDNIKLTQSDTFQKGMKSTIGSGNQLKLFKSKEAKTILSKLEELGCGKSAGGRILFAEGTPDGKITKCARRGIQGMDEGLTTGKWKSPDQAKMARNIAETAGKIGKTGIGARVVAELFGPVALATLPFFEAGIAGYDTITSGTPFKEAINKTLLSPLLGDKLKADPDKLKQADILKMSDGPEKEMLIKYYGDVENLNRVINNYKQKAGLEQDKELYEAVDIMGYGDKGASATQAQKQIEAIKNKILQDRAQEKDYMTLSRAVDDPYAKALAESKEGELLAKRDANSLSSRLFGTENPFYTSPTSSYTGEVLPERIEAMKAKNIGMGDSELYSRDQIVNFLKTVPDMEVTDETVDFLQTKLNADYFRNVLNQPGMLGTQYSEGGIASLNVNKK